MIFIDIIGTEKVAEIVSPPTTGHEGLMITLIVILSINVLVLITKYFLDRDLKLQEIKISRKVAITEISIKTEAEIFVKLENLKNFQKTESHEMLDSIIEIEIFLAKSRLYICSKIFALTNECLDYFKKVVSNYNEKDIKKEKEFSNRFSKLYYGE